MYNERIIEGSIDFRSITAPCFALTAAANRNAVYNEMDKKKRTALSVGVS